MKVAILDTPAALAALAPEWHALWRRTDAAPFQSPHWLLPWWAAFGTRSPRVATLRHHGQLAGILPAYVLEEPEGPKLLPIGAGTTDYLDALGEGASLMLHALLVRAAADGVKRCDLIEIPPDAALRRVEAPPGWQAHWSDTSPCPVLRLADIPATIRRKLRMSRHRADRAGGWTLETATPATIGSALDQLVTLHQARWSETGDPGVLADPAVLAFHRQSSPALLDAGLLRLQLLRVGGTIAAAILALLAPGRVYFYLSGYDTAQSFVSPGTLLLGAMLEQAVAENRTEAHFLRGQESYKYAWGAKDRTNATLSLSRPCGRGPG